MTPLPELRPRYDVVVVGDGPAAAIAVCQQARAGKNVALFTAELGDDPHLEDALVHGAQLFAGIVVKEVEGSLVHFDLAGLGRERFEAPLLFVTAGEVIRPRDTTPVADLKRRDAIATVTPGLVFTESMRGYFSTRVTDADYERGLRQGRDEGSSFVFVLTLVADDVRVLVDADDHPARSIGTVVAPALSGKPMLVTGGQFNLFVDQPGEPPTRRMRYRMQLRATDGRVFFVDGFKVIRDDPGFDVWSDTTTLYITVYQGETDEGAVLGRGVLRILPADFARQMRTFQVTNATSGKQKAAGQLAFARVFLGTLFDTYAGAALGLPEIRRSGGIVRIGALLIAATVGAALLLWPWRPTVLRQQPEIVPRGPTVLAPDDVRELGLFPQHLRDRDLTAGRYRIQRLRLGGALETDLLAQDHGLLAKIPLHPPDIPGLVDLPLRRGYLTLMRLRDESDRVVAIGSQVETAALDSKLWKHDLQATSDWTITIPGRGILFLGQREGGTDIGELQAAARKQGSPWRGRREINHTVGPLPGGRGIVHGGTGEFRGVIGSFRELNLFTEVPAEGDMRGRADLEISLLHASRAEPPASARMIRRQLSIDLARDIIYRTGKGQEPVPAGLPRLEDPVLDGVSVVMAKLRDERGDVVGQAGSSRMPGMGQWTLLFPGEGSLYVAGEGSGRGVVVGGTGLYADARGELQEESIANEIRLALTLSR